MAGNKISYGDLSLWFRFLNSNALSILLPVAIIAETRQGIVYEVVFSSRVNARPNKLLKCQVV